MSQALPSDYLELFDTFIFDCDGVLWKGSEMIEGSVDAVQELLNHNKNVFFVTNNSTLSREKYAEKFAKKGFKGINKENILCSAYAAARYLSMNNFQGRVYVIGESGIYDELAEHNIEAIGSPTLHASLDESSVSGGSIAPEITLESGVKAVIVGFDRRYSYLKMCYAYSYVAADPECIFIATNTDVTYPTANGFMPGSGSLVKGIETALGKEALVTGKPSPILMDVVKSRVPSMIPERTLMVGDRLDTDILFGNNAGAKTLLVLSGISTRKMAEESNIKPTFIAQSVSQLLPNAE
mmetsp:Transcript_17992/g.27860  ORF Transcript_17992/g.27860 Transcript_17992/m.27860 type:complete len:296 (+) Transcript_17992:13-900(+)